MSVTIKDVARRAGVSSITASRAFSGTHPVAEETREKVFQAAADLNYVPDLLARGLARKQSSMIGVLVPELANPFFVTVIDAVQAQAQQHDHLVIINQSGRDLALERRSLDQLRQLRVAGVITTPASLETAHLRRLRDEGTVVVVVARRWEDGDYVTVDDYEGGRLVGAHLSSLGHGRIGCVALDGQQNSALQERERGFRTAVGAAGGSFEPQWMIHTDTLATDAGARAADRFCAMPDRPSAVFVTADHLAIGFVHRLLERGLRVPQDVAVVGYDDIVYSAFLEVPLTTVALSKYEMGRQAVEILFARLAEGPSSGPWRQIRLKPELVVRASCGARP